MTPTESTNPTPTPAPAAPSTAHANLFAFLKVLGILAPAIAAPFIPAGKGQQIFQAEVPIEQELLQALSGISPSPQQ